MNKKTKASSTSKGEPNVFYDTCVALNELFRRLGPPESARRHFDAARVEVLKGLRALIDARIEHISKANARGEKIEVM